MSDPLCRECKKSPAVGNRIKQVARCTPTAVQYLPTNPALCALCNAKPARNENKESISNKKMLARTSGKQGYDLSSPPPPVSDEFLDSESEGDCDSSVFGSLDFPDDY